MDTHKFKMGQRVTVAPNNRGGAWRGGTFTVVRPLPEERGVWQYRVKSVTDGHERVVSENDLTR
jgi:hypothetical protein